MRCRDYVRHLEQRRGDVGLMLEHVEAGAGDLPLFQGTRERRLVDDRPARGVDQERGRLHQLQFPLADLMARLGIERRMQRDEIRLREQMIERPVAHHLFALEVIRLMPWCYGYAT